jgi:rubrerythrin
MRHPIRVLVLILVFAVAFLSTTPTTAAAAGTSMDNLQAAFNGESNAHAKYLAFSKMADKEGFGSVASLFRAAAAAEKVHADTHASVIKAMGGVPKADVKPADVKSTKENLEAAVKGETYERDTMYPEFITTAKTEGNKDALKAFNFAKTAEAEHAKMYAQDLASLATLKGKTQTYWVCTICGYTVPKIDFEKCPSCFNPKDKYVEVK